MVKISYRKQYKLTYTADYAERMDLIDIIVSP